MTREDIARSVGCTVVETRQLNDGTTAIIVTCPSHKAKLRLLVALAHDDAHQPEVRRLAENIVRGATTRREQATKLMRYVQQNVLFTPELGEVFAPAVRTAQSGLGDCDDSARLLYALLACLGFDPAMSTLGWPPNHVAVTLNGTWLETTIAANYGEHPIAAKRRLGQSGGIR